MEKIPYAKMKVTPTLIAEIEKARMTPMPMAIVPETEITFIEERDLALRSAFEKWMKGIRKHYRPGPPPRKSLPVHTQMRLRNFHQTKRSKEQ